MIKVAIVGTNGLAQLIAHYISTTTSDQFVILSRRVCIFYELGITLLTDCSQFLA